VADRLPLFPLGSVVVPGQLLPLHVFEPRYRALVQEVPDLPDDPRALSYVVAAGTRIDLDDRQALLEVPDDAGRLRAALALLRREVRLMRALRAVPAPELARVPLSPN